ncbi:hypothetical protein T484DRAFT_1798381 [Baffinella frigidus]|nr:hypothetical protein T484DRAFT_1798381 [Cryptophyta sp. CCMP2293]
MLVAPRRRVPSAGGVLACMAALTVASCASGPISQLEQPALRATELGAMHLRGGSAAVLVPTIQRQGSQYQLVPDEEVLGSHKASLRASAQRPELLNRAAMKAAPKAAPTLSLVRPTFQKEEDGGKNGTVEEGKKFQAFKGTGQTILTQEQVKDTMGSSSTMHKLAIERLQRLKSQSATAEGEESIAEAEAALRRYETTHLTRPVSAVSGPVEARSDVMIARLKRMDAEQFGETTGRIEA